MQAPQPTESSKVEQNVQRAKQIVDATTSTKDLRTLLTNAAEQYEDGEQSVKVMATKQSMKNTGLSEVNEGMADLAFERRQAVAPAISEEVLKEQVMLYTPGGASMESGIQFIPHYKIGADAKEQAVVDSTNAESLLESQYSRIVMPQNGRIYFSGAVVNNIITETAEKPVMTRFRGKENIGVDEALKYHPLGYESHLRKDKSIWAYSKEDLYRGINAFGEMTSNIEYLPQAAQLNALKLARKGDGAIAALSQLYASSKTLAEFDNIPEPQTTNLDSANPLPARDEQQAEYTDSIDIKEVDAILAENRRLNGTSSVYAPSLQPM